MISTDIFISAHKRSNIQTSDWTGIQTFPEPIGNKSTRSRPDSYADSISSQTNANHQSEGKREMLLVWLAPHNGRVIFPSRCEEICVLHSSLRSDWILTCFSFLFFASSSPFFSFLLFIIFFSFSFFFSYLFGKLILHLKYIFFFNFASVFSIFGWAQVNVFDPLSASWILNWNWSCGGDECRDLTIHIQNSPRSHPWVFLLGQFRRHSRQYFRYSGILIGDKSGRLIADQFRRGLAGADLRARPVPNKSIRTFDRCNAIECGHILRILCLAAVRRPSQSGGHTAHDWSETISRR